MLKSLTWKSSKRRENIHPCVEVEEEGRFQFSVFRFQLPCFFFLTPDSRNLSCCDLEFLFLQCSRGLSRMACLRILNRGI
jgi:hypothetical protein